MRTGEGLGIKIMGSSNKRVPWGAKQIFRVCIRRIALHCIVRVEGPGRDRSFRLFLEGDSYGTLIPRGGTQAADPE